MDKPVEEMTREEVAAELARVRADKAVLNGDVPAPVLVTEEAEARLSEAMGFTAPETKVDGDESEPAPSDWPHQFLDHAGLKLEVRKPSESALVAIAMTGVPALGPQGQMRIFSTFLSNHMSRKSFVEVVEAMTDPDSEVSIQGVIEAMTKL